MKKKINTLSTSLRDRIDDKLHYLCGLISPDSRLVIIILLLLVGVILNFYFMFSTINNWTKSKERMNIEHMNTPEIQKQGQVEQFKPYMYGQQENIQPQD